MFSKKALLKLPDLNAIKKGEVSFISVIVNIDKNNFEKVLEAGYNPAIIKGMIHYKYPEKWIGNTGLYLYLLLQDLSKGRVFNEFRYPTFCMLKKQIYGQELTTKEAVAYKQAAGKQNVEMPDETSDVLPTPTLKAVVAFAASAPKVGKTTTTEKLKEALEKEGLVVEVHTIAVLIRSCLATLATVLNIDSSRFFDEYDKKDEVIAFGNEPVPFKTRDLLCDFSVLMQKYYGKGIWGASAADDIEEYEADVVFIDDLRRPDELEVLRQRFGEKLITIYLDKEDVDSVETNQQLSEAAQKFESKLSKEDLDHTFTFTSDWSNTSDLLALIKSKID